MRKSNRKKASDVFRDSNFLLSKKVSFEEAFPEIKDISIEVTEKGKGVMPEFNTMIYSNNIGEFINCSNDVCYNGGFSIGEIIREMIASGQSELDTTKKCQGYEGSPKGRKRYRSCLNYFKIKVSIIYKEESNDAEN
jgi:hypothetical protein